MHGLVAVSELFDRLEFSRPVLVVSGQVADALMRREVKPANVAVYVALHSHCRKDRVVWPSVPRLSAMTGVSERRVSEALRELRKRGWITKVGETPTGVSRYHVDPQHGGDADVSVNGVGVTFACKRPDADVTLKGIEEGISSLEEEAAPPGWGTSDFRLVFEGWPGRKSERESRIRFFELARNVDWLVQGEGGLVARLGFYVESYRKLNWPLPPLQHVLKVDQEQLTDHYLDGLKGDVDHRRPARGGA